MSMEFSFDKLVDALANQDGQAAGDLYTRLEKLAKDNFAEWEPLAYRERVVGRNWRRYYRAFRALGGPKIARMEQLLAGLPDDEAKATPEPEQPPVVVSEVPAEKAEVAPRIIETAYGDEVVAPPRQVAPATPRKRKPYTRQKKGAYQIPKEELIAFFNLVKDEFKVEPTGPMVADYFGFSPAMANRLLRELGDQGLITKNRKPGGDAGYLAVVAQQVGRKFGTYYNPKRN